MHPTSGTVLMWRNRGKGGRGSDNKTGKFKRWKGVPKREVEEIEVKRNGRTVRELI
jgi:hypothetical protein